MIFLRVFHLSHTDLDGYSCQFITKEFFQDISFYNANYGKEVFSKLNLILDSIQSLSPTNNTIFANLSKTSAKPQDRQRFLIIITDLNLTLNECKFLNQKATELRDNADIEILLLDHHITGQESSNSFEWYHLDTLKCATKITYEYMIARFEMIDSKNKKWLKYFVEMVNSVDIWLEDGYGFDFGKVAMSMIMNSYEINKTMFEKENRKYKFSLLESTKRYLTNKDGTYIFDAISFDNNLHILKKELLGGNPQEEIMDDIIANKNVALLSKIKDECKVFYGERVGFLSYGIGGISVLANKFLQVNDEFDFFIDIGNKGSVSLRSNDRCDVSELSQICFNGGGHKNASGGRLEGFRDGAYQDIREQVQTCLDTQAGVII